MNLIKSENCEDLLFSNYFSCFNFKDGYVCLRNYSNHTTKKKRLVMKDYI